MACAGCSGGLCGALPAHHPADLCLPQPQTREPNRQSTQPQMPQIFTFKFTKNQRFSDSTVLLLASTELPHRKRRKRVSKTSRASLASSSYSKSTSKTAVTRTQSASDLSKHRSGATQRNRFTACDGRPTLSCFISGAHLCGDSIPPAPKLMLCFFLAASHFTSHAARPATSSSGEVASKAQTDASGSSARSSTTCAFRASQHSCGTCHLST